MTDAHCHPWDLLEYLPAAEEERRRTGTACAANAWNLEQFQYHENLAGKAIAEGAPPVFCCFALHPQLSTAFLEGSGHPGVDFSLSAGLDLLHSLGAEGRLDAVGETGFDLFDENFRAGEKIQEDMFACHLEVALRRGLPLVLHLRRAMHKIFPFTEELKKLPAVVFHSWPGTRGEGEAMLRRGINAFFSFGTVVLKNHRQAMACAAVFPADRVLLETDAPYQRLQGKPYSSWRDLDAICSCIASLRRDAGSPCAEKDELAQTAAENFFKVFSRQNLC